MGEQLIGVLFQEPSFSSARGRFVAVQRTEKRLR